MALQVRSFHTRFSGLEIRADFTVQSGERVVLSGPSGSGKTTLFRFICGLHSGLQSDTAAPAEGRVWLEGREITDTPPEKREIGVVFQEPTIFPYLSVLENAALGLRVRGVGATHRRELTLPWLERVGLGAKLEVDPDLLSGGEKQRLALVRALVWKPKALLLDEPFTALDPALRLELGSILMELHQSLTIPLLLVTHDRTEAERLGTRELECQVLSASPRIHVWNS
jgi:ABC-type Fe3+/spermidine/putrescine transport system ATPase subunit